MKRRAYRVKSILPVLLLSATALLNMGGCTGNEAEKEVLPEVHLSVWCSEDSVPIMDEAMGRFVKLHEKEASITYVVSAEKEETCRVTVLNNPAAAADIFCFADDQLEELVNGRAIMEVGENAETVLERVGGAGSGAAEAATAYGTLYAYPLSAGNGYFLYYNKAYLEDKDVADFDSLLAAAGKCGKKVSMDMGSGWYMYSFFKGAGLYMRQNDEGTANICNWNAKDTKYKGVDVVQAMLDISMNPAYINLDDDCFVEAVRNGSVIAGINGAWNAEKIAEAWGDDYCATRLPAYTINGDKVQMYSLMGYKLMGVSSYTKEPEWSRKAAEYLSGPEVQLRRFEAIGECPADISVAKMDKVQAAPAIAALAMQSEYGCSESILDTFWSPAQIMGIVISAGNPDGCDLQELLDEAVEGITESIENKTQE